MFKFIQEMLRLMDRVHSLECKMFVANDVQAIQMQQIAEQWQKIKKLEERVKELEEQSK